MERSGPYDSTTPSLHYSIAPSLHHATPEGALQVLRQAGEADGGRVQAVGVVARVVREEVADHLQARRVASEGFAQRLADAADALAGRAVGRYAREVGW